MKQYQIGKAFRVWNHHDMGIVLKIEYSQNPDLPWVLSYQLSDGSTGYGTTETAELERSLGFCDRNGTPIYVNDILEVPSDDHLVRHLVVIEHPEASMGFIPRVWPLDDDNSDHSDIKPVSDIYLHACCVIGNVHQLQLCSANGISMKTTELWSQKIVAINKHVQEEIDAYQGN